MNIIVNLNKPPDMTSQQAVTRVKRIMGARKAGHAGTLDPLATGVLLVFLDEATKVSRFFLGMDKRYRAKVKLGERTDTLDAEGTVLERRDVPPLTEAELSAVAGEFRGRISQTPPMYSAVKVGGRALHTLARKGIEIERPSRTVEIYDINIDAVTLPFFDMEVSCSKGTYIRTLCEDIGQRLGTGAHLAALVRTGVGPFDIAESVGLAELEAGLAADSKCCVTIDEGLKGLPEVVLEEDSYRKALHGVKIKLSKNNVLPPNVAVRLKGPAGNLFAIGHCDGGEIRIERIIHAETVFPDC